MKYYYFNSVDDYQGLLDIINNNPDEKITIYIDCQGGDCHKGEMLIDVINKNKDRIKMICSGYIFSMGFTIFFSCKCKRKIFKHSLGLMHLSGKDFRVLENGKVEPKENDYFKALKNSKSSSIKFCKNIGITDEQIKRIKAGEDVFFYYKDLKKLLKNTQ